MLFRRNLLPTLTEAEIRRNLRPHSCGVKGESSLVKADRAIRLSYIAPMREAMSRPTLLGR